MSEKRECHTCRWFDPIECYCIECMIFCHGGDGAECDYWKGGWTTHERSRKDQAMNAKRMKNPDPADQPEYGD